MIRKKEKNKTFHFKIMIAYTGAKGKNRVLKIIAFKIFFTLHREFRFLELWIELLAFFLERGGVSIDPTVPYKIRLVSVRSIHIPFKMH